MTAGPDLNGSTATGQTLVALDLEGVLTPEIWSAVAAATGIEAFARTTRDEPHYPRLVAARLAAMTANELTLGDLVAVAAVLEPLPGAVAFLDRLRARWPVVILSDTFEQLAAPLLDSLGRPLLLCHRFETDRDVVVGAELRRPDAKRAAVDAFGQLGYRVVAIGDSFNDLAMLDAADDGLLFRPPPAVVAARPTLPRYDGYAQVLAAWGITPDR